MPPPECVYKVSCWYLKACLKKVLKTRTDIRTDGVKCPFSNGCIKKELGHRCSITAQPCNEIFVLHMYKLRVIYPCKHRSYDSLKSKVMLNCNILPLHFDHKDQPWQDSVRWLLHISTQFFFLWRKCILLTLKRFLGSSILLLDNYLCYEENENVGKKRYFVQNMKHFQK